jgi:predicted nucleic acid-binding protein
VSLVACDATVIAAALVAWHERHASASSALENALARKALVIPAPALIEAYATLTSLPAQHRLTHADAFHLLRSSFSTAKIPGPKPRDTWSTLRRPIGGNDTFDAMILEIAKDAGAKTLLSFRRRELELLAVPGIEVVEPV